MYRDDDQTYWPACFGRSVPWYGVRAGVNGDGFLDPCTNEVRESDESQVRLEWDDRVATIGTIGANGVINEAAA